MSVHITALEQGWLGQFQAMASPCTVLVEGVSAKQAQECIHTLAQEVWRIEQKYSRYRPDSVLSQINAKAGLPTKVDAETAQLLNVAQVLWQLSAGRFDITSGVLRKVWRFNVDNSLPTPAQINALLPHIGWDKVRWANSVLTLLPEMQIDFGGIGKEYAADRCVVLAQALGCEHCLTNLGGDLASSGMRVSGELWQVGIEACAAQGQVWQVVPLGKGGMATSGDSVRFITAEGKRYGHILNALTGWPMMHAPCSVTVAAPNCSEAGMLSTLALLQAEQAETFLKQTERPYWVQWY